MVSFTNVYWVPHNDIPKQTIYPISRHQNFNFDPPVAEPVTAGWFVPNDKGPMLNERTTLQTSMKPEYYAVDGQVPTRGGKVALSKEEMHFKRKSVRP